MFVRVYRRDLRHRSEGENLAVLAFMLPFDLVFRLFVPDSYIAVLTFLCLLQ